MLREKLGSARVSFAAAFSVITVVAATLSFTPAASAIIPSYTIRDLGGFTQFETIAYGINDLGQVVGYSRLFSGDDAAFLWQNGTMSNLGHLGGNQAAAYEINNSRQIVGHSNIAGGHTRAFLWQNSSMTNLGTLGGDRSYAYGINEAAQIVGDSEVHPGGFYEQAFIAQNGAMQKLTAASGTRTQASAINDLGETVGSASSSPDGGEACIWQGATRTMLGVLGNDTSSVATDINNARQVVGLSGSQGSRPFMWQNGVMSELPNYGEGTALAINEAGTIVGSARFANGTSGPAIWENGQLYDLRNLIPSNSGWVLFQAHDINELGQIIAMGRYQNGQFTRSVLLTPIPEPGCLWMLLASSMLFARARAKRRTDNR